MVQVGVVLGAGGIIGAAFHAGVLTALAEAGFDARQADLLVGTSAGAAVAATLRAGFPPIDLAPRTLGEPISTEAAALVGRTGGPPTIDLRPRPFSRVPRPASPMMLLRSGGRPGKAFAGLMPTGTISTDEIGDRMTTLYGSRSWPDDPLWICAVDLDRGDRVVFGREGHDAPIGIAVQASSAIPGVFRPAEHDGRRYVDGAVHSPTNADLLADTGLDAVVIVSPMSATPRGHGPAWRSLRPVHAQQLANEVKALRARGIEVITFQPTPADVAAMGRNAMDVRRREATTTSALACARARISRADMASRLAALGTTSP
jgi:NTE family protein